MTIVFFTTLNTIIINITNMYTSVGVFLENYYYYYYYYYNIRDYIYRYNFTQKKVLGEI